MYDHSGSGWIDLHDARLSLFCTYLLTCKLMELIELIFWDLGVLP